MQKDLYRKYLDILNYELAVALGCTEPMAISFAAAAARDTMGLGLPDRAEARCSGCIIKNVKSVTVPNSGGRQGIPIAVAIGLVGGAAEKKLAVVEDVTERQIAIAQKYADEGRVKCSLVDEVDNLYIDLTVYKGEHSARVIVSQYHTNIVYREKDGKVLFDASSGMESGGHPGKESLTFSDILDFADEVSIEEVRPVIEREIKYNTAIAKEGLKNHYGAEVGRTLLEAYGNERVEIRARAYAAAGSDARMSGCPLPVVINSGSGNQGMTLSLPVIAYAQEYGVSEELLFRSLVVANLLAVHQKKYIGNLSAYCGAVSAACGAAAGIAYMMGLSRAQIADTITNTIATTDGIVCDGAKASCASKISTAVEGAITGMQLAKRGHVFKPGEGLVQEDVEATIASVGRMGREGMKYTNTEILNIMLGN